LKVLVIGATGLTGGFAVRKLLARGDQVTALARSAAPSSLPVHERLTIAVGEARDGSSLERAARGQDAVLSAFGPRAMKRDNIQEAFMRKLVEAMTEVGVKRLANLSAWGTGDSYSSVAPLGRLILRTMMKDFFADKARGEAFLFASSLDYVNVRPNRLSNRAARGKVKASLNAKDIRWWPLMTREDTADFMIEQLTADGWLRKSPLIGY
jgi:uncharacterized protein YbjT (DUF2867 family)